MEISLLLGYIQSCNVRLVDKENLICFNLISVHMPLSAQSFLSICLACLITKNSIFHHHVFKLVKGRFIVAGRLITSHVLMSEGRIGICKILAKEKN